MRLLQCNLTTLLLARKNKKYFSISMLSYFLILPLFNILKIRMILLLIEMPFAFFLLTCFFSCERNTTPVTGGPDLTLSAEDVSCTEVWLKAEGIDSHKFLLERDGGEIENYSLIDGNIIYEDSLRPNTTYSYRLTRLSGAERSREVTATTLDTTSHDFNWETFTFGGEARNCILNDCAILSEDDIWCVGAIYLKDSLGNPDPSAYNAVHWDGNEWELNRICAICVWIIRSLIAFS
jgi:hypothetical protein